MKDFLKKLNLSDESIEIYLKSLGLKTYSYYELFSLNPKLSSNVFDETLNQLINLGLLYRLKFSDPNILPMYIAIQPNKSILTYFKNINKSYDKIKQQISENLTKSVIKLLDEQSPLNLKDAISIEEKIRKDFEDESLIFKNDIEDASTGIEELKKLQRFIPNLNNEMIGSLQAQISKIIKDLDETKSLILDKLHSKEFKQSPKVLSQFIEEVFEKEAQLIAGDLSAEIEKTLSSDCENFEELIDKILETVFQHKTDLKLLSLNMLSSFEFKLNKYRDVLKAKSESAVSNLKSFETDLVSNLTNLISKSLNDIQFLNDPVIKVLDYFQKTIWNLEKTFNQNIWVINSITKINEEIVNIINYAEKNVKIIVPNLKNFLSPKLFLSKSDKLNIKIFSSDPLENSTVREFQKLPNLVYNQIDNQNLIAIVGDNKIIALGVINGEEKDPLNDFIGFGSNDATFIAKLFPNLESLFGSEREIPTSVKLRAIPKPEQGIPAPRIQKSSAKITATTEISPPTGTVQLGPPAATIDVPSSRVKPKDGDQIAIDINHAFNQLISKVDSLEGLVVSKELLNISDLILEKKGFSTVLHKIRAFSAKFKKNKKLLTASEKTDLLNNIEEWKFHLFS